MTLRAALGEREIDLSQCLEQEIGVAARNPRLVTEIGEIGEENQPIGLGNALRPHSLPVGDQP